MHFKNTYWVKLLWLKIASSFKSKRSSEKYFQEQLGHYDARFFNEPLDASARHRTLLNTMRRFSMLCTKAEVRLILMHGGLLGWFWNEQLLPWDHDIDICLFYEDLERLESLKEDLVCESYLLDINPNHRQRHSQNTHHLRFIEQNRIDARFIDKSTGLYIDITALTSGLVGFYTKCPHIYKRKHILPLKAAQLEGIPIFVPSDVRAVLIQEYGEACVVQTTYQQHAFDPEARVWRTGSPALESQHTGTPAQQ